MNSQIAVRWLSGLALFCVLVAVNQCSRSNDSIAESLRYRARADLADSMKAEIQLEFDSVRGVYDVLSEQLDSTRARFLALSAVRAEERAEARELSAKLVERIERHAGDSTATVALVDQLVETHETEVSALEDVNEALQDERAILYQRLDVAEDLLATQLDLTQIAETSIASYQASANEAIQAMNQRVRRDRFIQGFLVVATAIAVLR